MRKNLTTEEFILKAKLVHGDVFVYPNDYINSSSKINIICPKHGCFEQRPNDHLSGYSCPTCRLDNKPNKNEFILKAKLVHGNKFNYSDVNFVNNYTKVLITCDKHGFFSQKPQDHIAGNGCPICRESRGERQIRVYFEDNGVEYIRQHRFTGCKDKSELSFDYYLPEYNICLEFNGVQHYKYLKFFHKDENGFNKQIERDNIKYDYCIKNNINLIIIKYDENVCEKLKGLIAL